MEIPKAPETEAPETVVIGAGQAGLAASRALADRGVDHVVLERGRIGEAWRSGRWDSARLLTPNWMTRLPGFSYRGDDSDGFMSMLEVATFFEDYAHSFSAPVREGVEVTAVRRIGERLLVDTADGSHTVRNVVVASGHLGEPRVPAHLAGELPPTLHQLHSSRYRNERSLPAGGVLVVGGGASGLQIADELRRSGRRVVLAVGGHSRAPRSYRDRDVCWWLDRIGILDQTVDETPDLAAALRSPNLGLTAGRDLDLGTLQKTGVEITGRLVGADGAVVRLAGDLAANLGAAERRLHRLLDRFDHHATQNGLDGEIPGPWRPLPITSHPPVPAAIDLDAENITTVLWCSGYTASYPWLHVPVLDANGRMRQHRGVTAVPGLYVLGMRWMWRRGSHFIDGVGTDAEHVATVIAAAAGVDRAA